MKRTILGLIAATAFALPAALSAQVSSDQVPFPAEGQGAPQAISELAAQWTQTYNAGDAAALGALYTENAHLYLHGLSRTEGRDAIQEAWAADMDVGAPLTLLTVTHFIDGTDMRLAHGNYQVIDRDTGLQVGQGRFAHIWTLEDGEWLLDRDVWHQPSFGQ